MTVRLEIAGLGKRYGVVDALADANLHVEAGELVAIVGSSGSGKTTLLRALAGFVRADRGSIAIDGRDVTREDPRTRGVGIVFQQYALFPHLDVCENIGFGLRHLARAQRHARVAELLALVGLSGMERRSPRALSGGEAQRVAFARALAVAPRVLALDEPFAALDAGVRVTLRTWLREIHDRSQLATLLVTHDADEAMTIADRVVVLDVGRVIGDGLPSALYREPPSLVVMRALGAAQAFAGGFVRAHDVRIGPEDGEGTRAVVERIVSLGGRTRVHLRLAGETPLVAESAAEIACERGAVVAVTATRVHRFG